MSEVAPVNPIPTPLTVIYHGTLDWIELESLFIQEKPLASAFHSRHPEMEVHTVETHKDKL